MMELEIIAIILGIIAVILAALSIFTTGYWMSRAIKAIEISTERVVMAIHEDIKASQEKLERKLKSSDKP